jgi:hypothetical protein
MSDPKPHKLAAFEDPDSEDTPLLGVIIGSIEDPPIKAEKWSEKREENPTPDAAGMWVLNTYSGAFMIAGKSGYWSGDFADLPELLEDTGGWVPNE